MTTRDMAAAHFWSMSSDRKAICTPVLPCAQGEVQGVAFNLQSLRYFWLLLHDPRGQNQFGDFCLPAAVLGVGASGFSRIYLWLHVTWTLVAKIVAVHSHVGRWNKYKWLLEKVFLTKSRNHMLFFHILLHHTPHSFLRFQANTQETVVPLVNSTSLLPFHSIIHRLFSTFVTRDQYPFHSFSSWTIPLSLLMWTSPFLETLCFLDFCHILNFLLCL